MNSLIITTKKNTLKLEFRDMNNLGRMLESILQHRKRKEYDRLYIEIIAEGE